MSVRPEVGVRCPLCQRVNIETRAPLTSTQSGILAYIKSYKKGFGCAPTFQQIANVFGYRSLATVHEHIHNIERKGWIAMRFNEVQSIEVLAEP